MFRLALAQLRRRPLRYISLFFSIAIAVSLTVATAAISQSLRDSVHSLYTAPYESADVVVGLHNATPEQARQLQTEAKNLGASAVAFDQQVIGTRKSGSDQLYQPVRVEAVSSGPLMWQEIVDGRAPERPGEVLISAPEEESPTASPDQDNPNRATAKLGETIMLNLPTRGSDADVPVKVVGHTQPSPTETLIGTESLYAFPTDVATWAGHNEKPDQPVVNGELRIALPDGENPATFAEKLQQSVRNNTGTDNGISTGTDAGNAIEVTTADSRAQALADQYFGKRDHYFVLLDAFVAVVAIVAALVIFSSYQVLAAQRRREFALIRSIGGRTGQLVSSVIAEAAILATVAGLLAAPFGLWLASFAGRHASAVGVRVPLTDATLSPFTTFAVALVGVGLAVLAAVPAAWMAARRPVVESLSSSESGATSKAGAILTGLSGVAFLAAGLWLGQRMVNAAADGVVSTKRVALAVTAGGSVVLGAMLLFALVWPLVLGLLGRVVKFPVLQLALSYAGRQRLRSGALVAIVFAGSALVGAVVAGQDRVASRLEEKAAYNALADVSISSLDGRLPSDLAKKVRRTPGVQEVVTPKTVSIDVVERAGARSNRTGASVLGSETAYTVDSNRAGSVLRDTSAGARPGELVVGRHSGLRNLVRDGEVLRLTILEQPVETTVRKANGQFTFIDESLVERARQSATETRLRQFGFDASDKEAAKAFESQTGKMLPDFPVTLLLARLEDKDRQGLGSPESENSRSATVERIKKNIQSSSQRLMLQDGIMDRKNSAASVERVLTIAILMMVAAVLITTVGVSNVIAHGLAERARDRELLRSLGVESRRKRTILALENLLLCGITVALGCALGWVMGLKIAWIVVG